MLILLWPQSIRGYKYYWFQRTRVVNISNIPRTMDQGTQEWSISCLPDKYSDITSFQSNKHYNKLPNIQNTACYLMQCNFNIKACEYSVFRKHCFNRVLCLLWFYIFLTSIRHFMCLLISYKYNSMQLSKKWEIKVNLYRSLPLGLNQYNPQKSLLLIVILVKLINSFWVEWSSGNHVNTLLITKIMNN